MTISWFLFGSSLKITEVASPILTSVPKRSACSFSSSIIFGPSTPFGYPGKLSTSVVVVSWPPGSIPVYKTGFKSALEAYIAAVYPAGPDPIINVLIISVDIESKLIQKFVFEVNVKSFILAAIFGV